MKRGILSTMVENVDSRPPQSPVVVTELDGVPQEFLDVAPYSHLNYRRFPDLLEKGQDDLIAKSGLGSFSEIDRNYGVKSFVRVMSEIRYDGQVRSTDKVTLYTCLKRIGETSIIFEQRMEANGAHVVPHFELVVAFVDSQDKKTRIPDEMRGKLQPYLLPENSDF